LETGLSTDSARLKELNQEFAVTLRSARNLGLEQHFLDEWNTAWNQRWVIVEERLRQINELVSAMDDAIASSDDGWLKDAMDAWEAIQANDVHLVETISAIRVQASAMTAAARIEWNLLATSFDADLETIHACSQALRVKLELLKEHPRAEVDLMVQGFLVNLPKHPQEDEFTLEKHQGELDAAVVVLEKEKHQAGGFLDAVKALFLWVENPEERVKNVRSLRID
jgi:hypothetical protein